MGAYLGDTEIGQIFLGSTEIWQAYLGNTKVWKEGGVTPPQPLPYDAKIEYLQCSGTQYIDTGIVGNLNTTLEISFNITSSSTYIAGCYFGSSNAITLYFSNNANQRFGNQNVKYSYSRNTDYIVNISKSGITINDTALSITATTAFSTDGSIWLMNCNTRYNYDGSVGKFYYAKIWDDGVLVRDYIPVRVGTTGYMYDKVSGQLFGNLGSGNFILGNDITT